MNEQIWQRMSEEQQTEYCLSRLAVKLQAAAAQMTRLQPGNAETLVMSGLTTIIARKEPS